MKQGYIVCNLTNYGDGYEIFGVFRSREKAIKHLDKVFKLRYGKKYSKCEWSEICDIENDEDSFRIIEFSENDGFLVL